MKITIDDEKKFWQAQIDRLSFDITDLEISEKKRLMLIMQLRNAQLIYKFITSPEDAKEFFESTGLKIEYVTVFAGDEKTPPDEESYKIWQSLGIKDVRKSGREDNFWGPTGAEGPCGPTTEVYINGIEIWNIVFNQYYKQKNRKLEKLKTPGVDTGMGLERLAMVSQGKKNIFDY